MTEALLRLRKVSSASSYLSFIYGSLTLSNLSFQEMKDTEKNGLFDLCLYLGPDQNDSNSDPFTWFAILKGPPDSPYENGTFRLKLSIPEEYPERAPRCEFLT